MMTMKKEKMMTFKMGIMIHRICQMMKKVIRIEPKTKEMKNKMVKKVNLLDSLRLNSPLTMYFSSLNGVISRGLNILLFFNN